jgi:hypothetical protein
MATSRVLVIALLITLASGAAAQEAKFVSVRPSPLRQSGLIKPNETLFAGKAQVTGTFEVIREAGSEGNPGYYRVLMKPDKRSREFLPHDSQRGPVHEVWLRNTDAALRALLSAADRKALASGRVRHVTGLVTLVLTSYRTGVDCDQRGYNAVLASVVQLPRHVVADKTAPNILGGC